MSAYCRCTSLKMMEIKQTTERKKYQVLLCKKRSAFAFSIESKYFNSEDNMLSMAKKNLLSFQWQARFQKEPADCGRAPKVSRQDSLHKHSLSI